MGNPSDLISLVVFSKPRALAFKNALQANGINASLVEVDAPDPDGLHPQHVFVSPDSLSRALKILESGDFAPVSLLKMTGMGNNLLIPVDFSPSSILAVRAGFALARKFDVEPIVMHCLDDLRFDPNRYSPRDFAKNFSKDLAKDLAKELTKDLAKDHDKVDPRLLALASQRLDEFKEHVAGLQASGDLPDVHFSTALLRGVPEEVIIEYAKQNKPVMVVMATRGIDHKESDLVGSVTAEVIDACRVPVYSIPDNYSFTGIEGIKNILFFCTLSNVDIVLARALMRTFDYPDCRVFLVPVSDRPIHSAGTKLDELAAYFNNAFPAARFFAFPRSSRRFEDDMLRLIDDNNIHLIIVPNKKASAISRFFRPTLAHRFIFERDIPLLVFPV